MNKLGLGLLAGAALALATALAPAHAATPKDTFVMAKNIDDIVSLDPGEGFELSNAMYIDLQTKLQKDSPIINLFQAISQTVERKNVKGFIAGPNPDTVFLRMVTK